MQKNTGLGRGLGSLIPQKRPTIMASANVIVEELLDKKEQVTAIDVERITPNPHQPRTHFDTENLKDLIESIREHGIIQPLIVTEHGDDWQLIAGERRWRSAKLLGLKTVPAIVREFSEQKKMEVALIENLQRANLNPYEVALAYQKLVDEFNLTQDQLAKRVGKSRSAVANNLRLLTLSEEVIEALKKSEITESHARVLAGLPEKEQLELLKKISSTNLSVHDTEIEGKKVTSNKKLRKTSFNPEIRAREEEMQSALGTKVEVKKKGHAGQILISFYSDEEMDELIRRIIIS